MASLAGWKDILRPIRDGYRHLFPAPDTGPTVEEREKQRRLDRLKGFTYFDTFDQLQAWSEGDSDPTQRSNTPLLARSSAIARGGAPKANVLICHDYSGNYHEYESASAYGLDEEAYCCEYLQYVESLVYFSHKLVCVPPPSWINTLHRNGVKALGTFLIEPQTKDTGRLLHYETKSRAVREEHDFPFAKQLSDIMRHYGFDGWLINIEKSFPHNDWDLEDMRAFLRQLKELIGPEKELIWYDALTRDNKVSYQNAVNSNNIDFASTCGAVLTNYCWKEDFASASKRVALESGIPLTKVYFGVDVWAQNTVDFGLPRSTYPDHKGGGTNTGVAVSKLAELDLAAGIFAPAWSFEHFPCHGRHAEHVMWEGGDALWDGASCSCRGETNFRHPANPDRYITKSATEYPAGSETFFYTDFSRAFGTHTEEAAWRLYNGKKIHSQLGWQSILPSPLTRAYNGHLLATLDSSRLMISRRTDHLGHDLPLFDVDMPGDGSLQLRMICRCLREDPQAITSIYLKFSNGTKYVQIMDSNVCTSHTVECIVRLDADPSANVRLQQLGICDTSPATHRSTEPFLEIHEIYIGPKDYPDLTQVYMIDSLRIKTCWSGDDKHWRLVWTYSETSGSSDRCVLGTSGLPYSSITGPFSYFTVQVDGVDLGRAYALEHVLPQAFMESFGEQRANALVVGIGFDGAEISRLEQTMVFALL